MWAESVLKKHLSMTYPIIQAPMAGGPTTPDLVAAVSNEGGLGSIGAGYLEPLAIDNAIKGVKALTDKPFGINLFIPNKAYASNDAMQKAYRDMLSVVGTLGADINIPSPPFCPDFDKQMEVVLSHKIAVFSFTFGQLESRWIKALKQNKTLIMGTATTVSEARSLADAAVDMIVLQGCEAGGHRGTFLGKAEEALLPLETLLKDCVQKISCPLIASGGLMTGPECQKMLRLGAQALQLGTAFLTTHESGAHPAYKQALVDASRDTTRLTRAFSGKLARGLNNTFIEKMEDKTILHYPIQNALTSPMRKKAKKENNIEFQSLWAGMGVSACKAISVNSLMASLVFETEVIS